jgi:hypothetical protein
VTIAGNSADRSVVVNVSGPAASGEAILLQVWDRALPKPLLHSMLIYPDSTGRASSSITISIGDQAADICAVAIQAESNSLHTSELATSGPCRIDAAQRQGWAELILAQPSVQSPATDGK